MPVTLTGNVDLVEKKKIWSVFWMYKQYKYKYDRETIKDLVLPLNYEEQILTPQHKAKKEFVPAVWKCCQSVTVRAVSVERQSANVRKCNSRDKHWGKSIVICQHIKTDQILNNFTMVHIFKPWPNTQTNKIPILKQLCSCYL